MPSMRFNASFDTSHHGQQHHFKDAEVVVDRLRENHNEMVKCPFVVNRSRVYVQEILGVPTGKNAEPARSSSGNHYMLMSLVIGSFTYMDPDRLFINISFGLRKILIVKLKL